MSIVNLRAKAAIGECIFNCGTNGGDIACIQETHTERNDRKAYKAYTIFYIAADKTIQNHNNNTHWANNWKGGVSIIIKNGYVETWKIDRLNSRIIEIKLKTWGELNYRLHFLTHHKWDMMK